MKQLIPGNFSAGEGNAPVQNPVPARRIRRSISRSQTASWSFMAKNCALVGSGQFTANSLQKLQGGYTPFGECKEAISFCFTLIVCLVTLFRGNGYVQ
jgi:hypothetical protein